MNSLLNNLCLFTTTDHVAIKIQAKYLLDVSCSNSMFEVVFDYFMLMIIGDYKLVSCLIKLRSYSHILLHFFIVKENLFNDFTNDLHWKLLIYYLLLAFVLLSFYPILSKELQKIFSAFFDLPKLTSLRIAKLLLACISHLLQKLEHTLPKILCQMLTTF